ncbi:MAG: hypothetical protein H7246_04870 [Phycisphaerae bacterium]|nr:hypothetical protein [Saprospiraceae bacterium]
MKEYENWEKLVQKMEQKNKKSRLWLALAITLPILLIGLFLFQNQKEKIEVEQKTAEVNLKELIADSIAMRATLAAQLKQRTLLYMNVLKKKNSDSLQVFYADTLDFYYVNVKNAPKSDIKKAEDYWFKRASKELVSLDSVDVISSNNQYTAYLNIKHSKDSTKYPSTPMFMVIKFNKNGQITFVKSYNNEVRDQ